MLEKDLLQQIKEGQVSAFEHIYHKYYDFLCRFSMHLLHDRLLVEEVVDDVLFYLWDHREEIRIDSQRLSGESCTQQICQCHKVFTE